MYAWRGDLSLLIENRHVAFFVDDDGVFADQDSVAGFDRFLGHATAIDESAVGAAQVLDKELFILVVDARVIMRSSRIIDGDIAIERAADGNRCIAERHFPQNSIAKFEREFAHTKLLR